jgi:hypothetical protein
MAQSELEQRLIVAMQQRRDLRAEHPITRDPDKIRCLRRLFLFSSSLTTSLTLSDACQSGEFRFNIQLASFRPHPLLDYTYIPRSSDGLKNLQQPATPTSPPIPLDTRH